MIRMKNKRAIIIKSPKLQKIRNNFRDLFYQSAASRRKKIQGKIKGLLLRDDGSRKTIDDLSSKELELFRDLQVQENDITDIINRSILSCVTCGNGVRDMVYNKFYKAWYCTSCYSLEQITARERARLKEPNSHREKVIKIHSKTFL